MTTRLNLISLCAVLLWIGGAGCVERPPEIKMHGSVTVTADGEKKQTLAKAQLGNEVIIVLPPPKIAGYVWQIMAHNSNFLRQRTEITATTTAAGTSTISFLAVRPGTTRIRFALVASANQAEVNPVDIQEVVLSIE